MVTMPSLREDIETLSFNINLIRHLQKRHKEENCNVVRFPQMKTAMPTVCTFKYLFKLSDWDSESEDKNIAWIRVPKI